MQETLLQWMSSSPIAKTIDRELGGLNNDLIGGEPQLSYLRYDVDLDAESVKNLLPDLTDSDQINSLSEMDAPENMEVLHRLGVKVTERDVKSEHFSSTFNLN